MDNLDIALCFDKNLVQYAGVLIVSIMETNRRNLIRFHIVHDGSLVDEDKDMLRNVLRKYKKEIYFYQIRDQLDNLPVTNYSPAAFIRIFLPQILPTEIGRVLYLDIDMIVMDDLKPLFETNLEGKYFACCIDDQEYSTRNFNRLKLEFHRWADKSYFNTGMMLMNLKIWRELKLADRVLQYMTEHDKEIYHYADQDVLNCLFYENVKIIDSRYNVLLNFMTDYTKLDIRREKWGMIESALKNPCIVHLYGWEHPWFKDAGNPYCKIWHYFAEKSGIHIIYTDFFHGKSKMRRAIRNFLSCFGLCAPASIQYVEKNFEYAEHTLRKIKKISDRGIS